MEVKDDIFRSFDIRGVVPDEMNVDVAYALGRVLPRYLSARSAVVGADDRETSPALRQALIDGLLETGVHVIDIGVATTPLFYFTTIYREAGLGVMVSASHNPPSYNGFKLVRNGAKPIAGRDLQEIKWLLKEERLPFPLPAGEVISWDPVPVYFEHLLSRVVFKRNMKVVLDAGNGSIGPLLWRLKDVLPIELVPLWWDMDGSFPNRSPNPLEEGALAGLIETVRKEGAAFGVAFDADADRAIFVDEKGGPVDPDSVTALLAVEALKREEGGMVVYDARTSRVVPETIRAAGGEPLVAPVGHSNIKRILWGTGAIFAGESTGHYYFKELGNVDDALFATLKVAEALGRIGGSFSETLAPFKRYYKSRERSITVEKPREVMGKLAGQYEGGEASFVDGITMTFRDWWFNVRSSQTESALTLRVNVEAETKSLLEEKEKELLGRLGEEKQPAR